MCRLFTMPIMENYVGSLQTWAHDALILAYLRKMITCVFGQFKSIDALTC